MKKSILHICSEEIVQLCENINILGGLGTKSARSEASLTDKVVIKAFLVHILSQHFNHKTLIREHAHIHVRIDIKCRNKKSGNIVED